MVRIGFLVTVISLLVSVGFATVSVTVPIQDLSSDFVEEEYVDYLRSMSTLNIFVENDGGVSYYGE